MYEVGEIVAFNPNVGTRTPEEEDLLLFGVIQEVGSDFYAITPFARKVDKGDLEIYRPKRKTPTKVYKANVRRIPKKEEEDLVYLHYLCIMG